MKMMLMILIMIILITTLLFIITMMISKKNFFEMEKSSPIECGMNPISSPRIPFSMQFFLIAILFMIFDVEIALIIPLPLAKMISMKMFFSLMTMFLLLLMLGLMYEWNKGALDWPK